MALSGHAGQRLFWSLADRGRWSGIRYGAFETKGTFLKGCLHVHTKRSDGIVAPEDALKLYEQNGYDFVALTDHWWYNTENYGENGLTILPGVEFDWSYEDTRGDKGDQGIHRIKGELRLGSDQYGHGAVA